MSGTVAAALGLNSSVFTMRVDPSTSKLAYVDRIRVMWQTIVAFTTPVTAGRRLGLYRGSGATPSAQTAIVDVSKKDSAGPDSEMLSSLGGDIRIANTGAITATGITFEANPIRILTLSDVGNAGNFKDVTWEFHAGECAPLIIRPGEVLAIRNPVAMDAGGTFQLGVNVDWFEMAAPS